MLQLKEEFTDVDHLGSIRIKKMEDYTEKETQSGRGVI